MLCPIQEPKWKSLVEKGSAMKRKSKLTIAIATAVLAVLGAMVVYAQDKDKYSLKSPANICHPPTSVGPASHFLVIY